MTAIMISLFDKLPIDQFKSEFRYITLQFLPFFGLFDLVFVLSDELFDSLQEIDGFQVVSQMEERENIFNSDHFLKFFIATLEQTYKK